MIQAHTEFGDLNEEAIEMLERIAEDSNARELASAEGLADELVPSPAVKDERQTVKREEPRAER